MRYRKFALGLLVLLVLILNGCCRTSTMPTQADDTATEASVSSFSDSQNEICEATLEPEMVESSKPTETSADEETAYPKVTEETKPIKPSETAATEPPKPDNTVTETQQTQTQSKDTEYKTPQESKPTEPEQTITPPPITEKPKEETTEEPTPEPVKEPEFDINYWTTYAKEYAQSIGLTLDNTAVDCWDNPISANAKRKSIKADIDSRLNRYKNIEGFTSVWIWAEKVSDTDYQIYIGYA